MDIASPQSEGSSTALMMHRYFYWGEKVQLLFSGWSTQSRGGYILTLAAVFLLALFHQWFGELKKSLLHLSSSPSSSPHLTSIHCHSKIATSLYTFRAACLRHRVLRAFLLTGMHVLSAASGYLLMLVVMSFNVGVFLSVLVGLAFGFILFET